MGYFFAMSKSIPHYKSYAISDQVYRDTKRRVVEFQENCKTVIISRDSPGEIPVL